MSKHFFNRQLDGQPKFTIDVGYDRPMQHFYLNGVWALLEGG